MNKDQKSGIQHDIIRPADVALNSEAAEAGPEPVSATPRATKQSGGYRNLIIGTALSGMFVAVFWGLPRLVPEPKPIVIQPAQQASPAPAAKVAQSSPFTEAEIANQRRRVQEILQDIMDLKEDLEERQVQAWANDAYEAAAALAKEADGIYRQRRFNDALAQYEKSLTAFQALRDSIPERLEQLISQGFDAIDSGDAETATQSFDTVLTMSKDHPRGLRGADRSKLLPDLWPDVLAAQQTFAGGQLDKALQHVQAALEIDPDTSRAVALLPRIRQAITDRDYDAAMSEGYAALAAGNFKTARTRFSAAAKLKPQETAPATGLEQAKTGITRQLIQDKIAQAGKQEKSENWQQALALYQALLKQDSSLVDAHTGKARSTARAMLDTRLEKTLEDPLILGDAKNNRIARDLLGEARQVRDRNPGSPRLEAQISKLETALTQAAIPVAITLQSDNMTDVVIYRVGSMGNFSSKAVALKPGRYVAVGRRDGYRDVRREFTVTPSDKEQVIVIQCGEKVIASASG
ncbi:tetratricopeptide repeat protein [Biformimicrobium ophioploci]|uniref:Tetratricopeptide repeat protein n=1 Tax=Biformimicrobium ophioploci TaxID=3036711 RepID=A0ABQ6LYJ7_9GAMM|nr:hypothetical protein [Microbulbifer sp. NKW57]GMG87176.1 hypothetical protein MNKW57_14970 [Microbulbifer sp. NKW57]